MPTRVMRGFSLIEILVALTILAIGLLGTLAMQLATLRASRASVHESTALQLASEIAEQLQNHARNAESIAQYLQVDLDTSTASVNRTVTPSCFGIEAHCSASELVSFDIQQWRSVIGSRLPGGRLRICRDASPWQKSTQLVRWACDDNAVSTDSVWIKLGWHSGRPGDDTDQANSPQLILPLVLLPLDGTTP